MIRDDIFTEEIELPEIVQKKADSAFLTIRAERKDRTEYMAKRKRKCMQELWLPRLPARQW